MRTIVRRSFLHENEESVGIFDSLEYILKQQWFHINLIQRFIWLEIGASKLFSEQRHIRILMGTIFRPSIQILKRSFFTRFFFTIFIINPRNNDTFTIYFPATLYAILRDFFPIDFGILYRNFPTEVSSSLALERHIYFSSNTRFAPNRDIHLLSSNFFKRL